MSAWSFFCWGMAIAGVVIAACVCTVLVVLAVALVREHWL